MDRMRELERDISKSVRVAIVVCRAHEDADIEAVSKLVAKQAVEQFEKLQGRRGIIGRRERKMKIDMDFVKDLSGYMARRPHWGLIDGADIDAQICLESKCEECGHQGLEYHPFVRDEPRLYRAFAVCPACGEVFEF